MSVELIKYEYDDTGTSPSNLGQDEIHDVHAETAFILPRGGCYFSNSLTLVDAETNVPLKKDLDYKLGNFFQKATSEVGQSIHTTIFFEVKQKRKIKLTAQYIGGKYSIDVMGIADLLNNVGSNGQSVLWDDIIKPSEGIKPTEHIHNVSPDLKGTQDVVEALFAVADKVLDLKQLIGTGVTSSWVEGRLDNRTVHIPDGDRKFDPKWFDNRTFVFIGHATPLMLTLSDQLGVKQGMYLYPVTDGNKIGVVSLAETPVHGLTVDVNNEISLDKGRLYKIDALGNDEFLITEHS